MKGLNDYIKEQDKSNCDFKQSRKLLSAAGYSIDLIQEDLKEYSTIITEELSWSVKNEPYYEIIMSAFGKEYHRFYFNSAEDILKNITQGLRNIHTVSYFDSPEYKFHKEMQDAKARASGFKDFGDMTRAYYEK